MGYSTIGINKPLGVKAELVSTSDFSLSRLLGKIVPVMKVWPNRKVNWEKSDNGKLFAYYKGMFCEYEL